MNIFSGKHSREGAIKNAVALPIPAADNTPTVFQAGPHVRAMSMPIHRVVARSSTMFASGQNSDNLTGGKHVQLK